MVGTKKSTKATAYIELSVAKARSVITPKNAQINTLCCLRIIRISFTNNAFIYLSLPPICQFSRFCRYVLYLVALMR